MCCGVALGLISAQPQNASFKKCPWCLEKATFSKNAPLLLSEKYAIPPSGCPECLCSNSGAFFRRVPSPGRSSNFSCSEPISHHGPCSTYA